MLSKEDLDIFETYFGKQAPVYIKLKYYHNPEIASKFLQYVIDNASLAETEVAANLRELDTLHTKFKKENNIVNTYNESFLELIVQPPKIKFREVPKKK